MDEARAEFSFPTLARAAGVLSLDIDEALHRAASALCGQRAVDVSGLLDRWRGRCFHALILGEFKRGKSTLLNALIGEDLLPTGVQPVTALPTRVRSGPKRRAVVHGRDGHKTEVPLEEVREYVDESRNPGNRRDAVCVEIELPGGPPPGVILVDVPGSGSVHRHNTEAAFAALPEADVALVVASVDPPVGEVELRLLRTVRSHAARVEVILNKVDYLDDRGRQAAEDFTRHTLAREGLAEVRVWPVSAREGLRARESGDEPAWRRSGMQALAEGLDRFFREERTAVLTRSLARKAGRLVEQESALLDMRRAAFRQAAEKLRTIIDTFRARRDAAARDATERALVFRRRFDSILAGCSERAAEAWKEPRARLRERLQEMQAAARDGRGRRAVLRAMRSTAHEDVGAFLGSFLPDETARLARDYARLCAEVAQAAAERAEAVWRLAAELLPFAPPRVEPPSTPPAPSPAFLHMGPVRLLLDDLLDAATRLLPTAAALRRAAAQALDEADVRHSQAVERVREAFGRAYEVHFRTVLRAHDESARQTAAAVETALEAAEARTLARGTGEEASALAEQIRHAELHELLAGLQRIEGEGTRPEPAAAEPTPSPALRSR
jgi:GTP-binding protein EngB required for normal cell division